MPDDDNEPITRREFDQLWEFHRREHAMLEVALNKASQAIDGRLEGMNQLRDQINTERSSYVSRAGYDERYRAIDDRINQLREFVAQTIGAEKAKANVGDNTRANIAIMISVGSVIIGLMVRLFWK